MPRRHSASASTDVVPPPASSVPTTVNPARTAAAVEVRGSPRLEITTTIGAPNETTASMLRFRCSGSLAGSMIGGIAETQEMLDFCGAHNITADVEVIPVQKVNEAYERLLKSDVKYRFSIDMASLKSE